MNVKNKIISQFNEKGRFSASDLIVYKKNCYEFIDFLNLEQLGILGLEGFLLDKNKTSPNQDEIADFSDLASEDWNVFFIESHKAALAFLERMRKVGTSHGFNFVYINKEEFEEEH